MTEKKPFYVGDIVIGLPEASKHYGITKEGFRGKVIKDINRMGIFTIQSIAGGDQFDVRAEYFELMVRNNPIWRLTKLDKDEKIAFRALLCGD